MPAHRPTRRLSALLIVGTWLVTPTADAQVIPVDEFDGKTRIGFAQSGLLTGAEVAAAETREEE